MPPRKDNNKKEKAPPPQPPNSAAAASTPQDARQAYLDSLTPEELEKELQREAIREKKAAEEKKRQETEQWRRQEAEREARRADRQTAQKEKVDEAYYRKLHQRAKKEGVLQAEYDANGLCWVPVIVPGFKDTWKEVQGDWWCPHCDAQLNDNVMEGHLDGANHKRKLAWATGQPGVPSASAPSSGSAAASSSGAAAAAPPPKAASASASAASASAAYPPPPQPWLCWKPEASFGPGMFLRCLLCEKWVQDNLPGPLHGYRGSHGFSGPDNQKDHKRKIDNISAYTEWLAQARREHGLPPAAPGGAPAAAAPAPGGAAAAPPPGGPAARPTHKAAPPQPWLAWQQDGGEWGVKCIMCKKWAADFYGGDEAALATYRGSHGFSGNDNQKDHARKIQNWQENNELKKWLATERRAWHPPAAGPPPPVRPNPTQAAPPTVRPAAGPAPWGKAPAGSSPSAAYPAPPPPGGPPANSHRPPAPATSGPPGPPPKNGGGGGGGGGAAAASFSKRPPTTLPKSKPPPPNQPSSSASASASAASCPPPVPFPLAAHDGEEPPEHLWLAWVQYQNGKHYLKCLGCDEWVSEEVRPNNLNRYRGTHGVASAGNTNTEAHAAYHRRYDSDPIFESEMEAKKSEHQEPVPVQPTSEGDPGGEDEDDDDDELEEC